MSRVRVPEVRTERLLLRGWSPARDAAAFAALNADPEVMRYIGAGAVLDRAASDALLRRLVDGWHTRGFGLWAVEARDAPGELLGFAGLSVPAFLPEVLPAVEVGWRVRRAAWGRGCATEAGRAALRFGFEACGMAEILAIVDPANDRSLRVCAKLGMARAPDRVNPATGGRVQVLRAAAPPGDHSSR